MRENPTNKKEEICPNRRFIRKIKMEERTGTNYKTILEMAQSQHERDELTKIKEQLGLRENDALWSIIKVLQLYERTVEAFNKNTKNSVYEAVKSFADKGGVMRVSDSDSGLSWIQLLFGLTLVFLLCVITFIAGISLSNISPPWLKGAEYTGGIQRTLRLIFSVPAGWILILVLTIPAVFYIRTYFRCLKFASDKKEKAIYSAILISLSSLVLLAVTIFVQLMF